MCSGYTALHALHARFVERFPLPIEVMGDQRKGLARQRMTGLDHVFCRVLEVTHERLDALVPKGAARQQFANNFSKRVSDRNVHGINSRHRYFGWQPTTLNVEGGNPFPVATIQTPIILFGRSACRDFRTSDSFNDRETMNGGGFEPANYAAAVKVIELATGDVAEEARRCAAGIVEDARLSAPARIENPARRNRRRPA